MEQNDVAQVGGDHYAEGGDYQHWDWVSEIELPYLEACATKYLTRWRAKNGILDLEKAISYVEKLRKLLSKGIRTPPGLFERELFFKFIDKNNIPVNEEAICLILCNHYDDTDLSKVIRKLNVIIATAQEAAQVPQGVTGAAGAGKGYYAALQGSEAAQTTKESK